MECEFSLEKEIEGIITNAVVLVSSYWRNVNSDSRTYHGASLVVVHCECVVHFRFCSQQHSGI